MAIRFAGQLTHLGKLKLERSPVWRALAVVSPLVAIKPEMSPSSDLQTM
jgi:hypothetical protein